MHISYWNSGVSSFDLIASLYQEIIAAPLSRGGDEVDDIAGNAFRPVAREAARADERDARIDQHRRWEDEAADLPAVDATRLAEHLRPIGGRVDIGHEAFEDRGLGLAPRHDRPLPQFVLPDRFGVAIGFVGKVPPN